MRKNLFKEAGIIAGIVFLLLVGFILTSFLSFSVTRNLIINSARSQTLPLISDNIYSVIKKDLLDPINVSSLMANDAFLIEWIKSGEKGLDEITTYLQLIREKYGYTSSFFVSEITGNYYYYEGILKQISPEDAHDVWYFDFKAKDVPLDLDVDNDEAKNGLLTVFINHRLLDHEGNFLGVTGVGLELRDIAENLAAYEDRYNRRIYMIDHDGLIQIHPDKTLVEAANIQNQEGISQISDEILSTKEEVKILEYKDHKGIKTLSIRYLPEFDWLLVVEKDQTASLQEARQSLWQNLLIGILVTIIISLGVIIAFKRYNQRLEFLASFDELTGLFNRRAFQKLLEREISIAQRYGYSSSLLMLDIDEFKSVNDQFGHFVGDKLIIDVVDAIRSNLRSTDIIGRWGGDELVIFLLRTDESEAVNTAQRIQSAVEEIKFETSQGAINRTVSIGITSVLAEKISSENLLKQADKALIKAKKSGKNSILIYSSL